MSCRCPGSPPATRTAWLFEVFCENGAAKFEQERSGEIQLMLNEGPSYARVPAA